ncbi:LysR family transcriptional regulator [Plantactinospora sp. CA-290183]|uniref:LysR family transcriptional regulator n=1 Tax=Plantactinospora sp. CA-290183 TaxID=3240006 RepID=UPI003D91394B
MLDLRRLRLLHEFSRRRTIAATAAALGYSPSAVSQQLAALERQCGRALLDRTARSAQLTDAGRRLAEHAARILAQAEAAEADLAATADTPSGQIAISTFPTAALALTAPAVQRLRRYPELHAVIRQANTDHGLDRLHTGEIDLALVDDWFGESTHRPASVQFIELLHDPLVLVVPQQHPLAADHDPVDLAALTHQPWIAAPPDEPSRRALDDLFNTLHSRPTITWEFQGLHTIVNLVAQGLGIAVTPRMALTDRHHNLVTRNLPTPHHRTIYIAIRHTSRKRPAVTATIDALRAAANDHTTLFD